MTSQYLALLRGINVGGNSLLKMRELKVTFEKNDFEDVRTYIQSGNVLFYSKINDIDKITKKIEALIKNNFGLDISVAVFSKLQWQEIINNAPSWWGKDENWKHNLIVLLKPYDMKQVIEAIGELKPDIEAIESGQGVLYQSMSRELFGRTTTGKLSSSTIYKKMTVRNYNTATKLLQLFD